MQRFNYRWGAVGMSLVENSRFQILLKFSLPIFVAAALANSAAAQTQKAPPRQDTRSSTGVSFRNGSFSFEETDLQVGGGFPTGLTLTRSYNSGTSGTSDPYAVAVGWSQSFNISVNSEVMPWPTDPLRYEPPPPEFGRCIYNLIGGSESLGFRNTTPPAGPPPVLFYGWNCGFRTGVYQSLSDQGGKLEFIETPSPGFYRLTGVDGSIMNFTPDLLNKALDWTLPDGTRLDFTYDGVKLKAVFSNRGWAILFESEFKACAVNTARVFVTPSSACPSDAQSVSYGYSPGAYISNWKRLTSVTKGGETTNYTYNARDQVDCVKAPGQTNCRIQNTYAICPNLPEDQAAIQPDVRLRDYVTSQSDSSGRTYNYTYAFNSCPQSSTSSDIDYRPYTHNNSSMSQTGIAGLTEVETAPSGRVTSFKDPLGRTSSFIYSQVEFEAYTEDTNLMQLTNPEGNFEYYTRDSRGNIISTTVVAKPGSGLADIVTSATYPATCTIAVTCNKPTSVTDARGAVTDFTYDPTHGGILTETAPSDANGIRAVKRYTYVQRTAWLKTSSGGYQASAWPIWVLAEMRTCRDSATVGNACAAGSTDEVVTTYDYGPDGGPNNLLLRGIAVASEGTTLRTCYSYDRDGRKISETDARANLTSCP